MELIIALFTTPLPFQPEKLGWWMLWDLRLTLVGTAVGMVFIGVRRLVRGR